MLEESRTFDRIQAQSRDSLLDASSSHLVVMCYAKHLLNHISVKVPFLEIRTLSDVGTDLN